RTFTMLRDRGHACSCVFFFFQAEAGIRDWSVTGVQPCALPILLARLGFRVTHLPVDPRGFVDPSVLPRPGDGHTLVAVMLANNETGRASCRERGEMSVGRGALKRKERGRRGEAAGAGDRGRRRG